MGAIVNPQEGYVSISTAGQGYIVLPSIYPSFGPFAFSNNSLVANVVYGIQVILPVEITIAHFYTLVTTARQLNFVGSSSVANHVGANTTYTSQFGFGVVNNAFAGLPFIVTGYSNANNNGTFTCVSNTNTTVTLANGAGVAQSPGTGTMKVGAPVGSHVGFGLYNMSGSKIVAANIAGGLGLISAAVTPVIVAPGVYHYCYTVDTTSTPAGLAGLRVSVGGAISAAFDAMFAIPSGNYTFTAANPSVAGALPATLGALTSIKQSSSGGVLICVCTP